MTFMFLGNFYWKWKSSFSCLQGISYELNWIFSCCYVSHYTCTLTLLVYSWFIFMRLWYGLYGLWVFSDHVIYMCFMKNNFVFVPCLKDFVLVNKISHLTSSYSSYGRDFQTYSIFKPIFENSYLQRVVGWETMLMYALW